MSKDITAKLKRLEFICKRLENAEKSFTAEQLAQECSVSTRTILRDMALLKEVGLELEIQHIIRGVYLPGEFAFKDLGLTSQTAASLCIAYEAAKQAGDSFATARRYIRSIFQPKVVSYEINPKLPPDPIVSKLQKAIKEKLYTKINTGSKTIYIKPYCLFRQKENLFLIFATTGGYQRSVWGYVLDRVAVKYITDVSFGAKSSQVKNGHFASLGVPKWEINDFIKDFLK